MPEEKVTKRKNADVSEWGSSGYIPVLPKPAADAGPHQPKPHSSQVHTDLTVRCHGCKGTLIWRYFEEKDEIEIFHNCAAPPVPQEAAPRECDCEECASRLATAPDEAMRVARQIVNLPISDMRVGGEQAVERVAALIREAGSEREREAFKSCAKELREHYNSDWDSTVPGAEFDAEILRILRKHLASRLLGGKSK